MRVTDGWLRLESLPGDTLQYGTSSGHPPWVQSGFQASRGTWVARLRFSDIRPWHVVHGSAGSAPLLSQAFWSMSPVYASRTPHWDKVGGSEINMEWNNYFYTPRSDILIESTSIDIVEFLGLGATVDGECRGGCDLGLAIGGIYPSAISGSGAPPLSCTQVEGYVSWLVQDPWVCQDSFGEGRDVVLFFQYDERELRWKAASTARGQSNPGQPFVIAGAELMLGRPFQPMTAIFSQIMATQAFCREHAKQPYECSPSRPVGFEIDWFIYSPETDWSIHDAVATADWLRTRGYNRLNTTQFGLQPPTSRPPLSRVHLIPPKATPSVDGYVWTLVMPLAWRQPPQSYSDISWRIRWWTRTYQPTGNGTWSPWQNLPAEGFSWTAPRTRESLTREVSVRADDWHPGDATSSVRVCIGMTPNGRTYVCEGPS